MQGRLAPAATGAAALLALATVAPSVARAALTVIGR